MIHFIAAFILANTSLSAQQAHRLAEHIHDASTTHGVDPLTIAALAWHESGFDEAAVSESGAIGIMQTMPKYWGRRVWRSCMLDIEHCTWWQVYHGAHAYAHYRARCKSDGAAITAYRRGHCGKPGPQAMRVLQTRDALRARWQEVRP